MDYTLMEVGIDDAETITDITLQSYEVAFNKPFYMARDAAIRRWKAYIRKEHHPQKAKEQRVIYAAFAGTKMIGYIAGHLTERMGLESELQSIYILPEHQRRGVGTSCGFAGLRH